MDDMNYCSVCFEDRFFKEEQATGKAVCPICGEYLFPDECDEDDDEDY